MSPNDGLSSIDFIDQIIGRKHLRSDLCSILRSTIKRS